MKRKKILYFIPSAHPTKEQWAHAKKIGASMRNASLVGENDNPESCDAVAGCFPKQYDKKGIEKIDTSSVDNPKPEPETKGGTPPTGIKTSGGVSGKDRR